jgi:gamma-glutamyltranspeptidase/glutathione hydrolase
LRQGAVAAGHPKTAEAARMVLDDGGNAFDAAMAAMAAACVAEPVLCSLGGGGFLLARPEGYDPLLYDFFVQTPKRPIDPATADFYPVLCDFGAAQQEFHVGLGAAATPGCVKGLFQVVEELGTMPIRTVVEPAMELARQGVELNRLQAYIFDVVRPIYMITEASRAILEKPDKPGTLVGEGDVVANRQFADFLDVLAIEGERLFYEGEVSAAIAAACRGGGALGRGDLEGYELIRRRPLAFAFGGAELHTNPPPSTGGILIAFAMQLLEHAFARDWRFGDADHLATMIRAMALTNEARVQSGLNEQAGEDAAERLLDPELLARYRGEIMGRPRARRGTTHISVIDRDGNAAAVTLSNGEGCGHLVPGTGVMLNNMLGEEDLNPAGFHAWPTDTRMVSMMAPTLISEPGGRLTALGSGGSNRIRTAIMQALVNLLGFGMHLPDAVEAPRCHFENGRLDIEPPLAEATEEALRAIWPELTVWESLNLFFGGVHAVRADFGSGDVTGAGDPRRGGVALSC